MPFSNQTSIILLFWMLPSFLICLYTMKFQYSYLQRTCYLIFLKLPYLRFKLFHFFEKIWRLVSLSLFYFFEKSKYVIFEGPSALFTAGAIKKKLKKYQVTSARNCDNNIGVNLWRDEAYFFFIQTLHINMHSMQ